MSALVDTLVDPVLLELRDCLCAEVAKTTAGPTCRCMVVHSFTLPVMDGCDCDCGGGHGDAWVRLLRLEPELSLPGVSQLSCLIGWQAVIELGTYRCSPLPEEGEALPERAVTDFALAMGSDRAALIRAVQCCTPLLQQRELDLNVEVWQPIGPEGGCAGSILTVRIPLPAPGGGC